VGEANGAVLRAPRDYLDPRQPGPLVPCRLGLRASDGRARRARAFGRGRTPPRGKGSMAPGTDMMEQWRETKARHKDAILLYRVGDFYDK